MDADAADVFCFAQPDMRPCAAGVHRFVDPVAIGHVEPYFRLASAGVDYIAI
jgi:hypothetical protein